MRIIGGRWRGTRIDVAAGEALRPSGDRVRETLFNWLLPYLGGARCLDLFAGTGVLGFEAVSRGAAHATLIEVDPRLVIGLEQLRARLDADTISIHQGDAVSWLAGTPSPFDIVFLDPPFATPLLQRSLAQLLGGWLSPTAMVYIEQPRNALEPEAPWQVVKRSRTRHVDYALLTCSG